MNLNKLKTFKPVDFYQSLNTTVIRNKKIETWNIFALSESKY